MSPIESPATSEASIPWFLIREHRVLPADGHPDAGSEVPPYWIEPIRPKQVDTNFPLLATVRIGPETQPVPVAWTDLGAVAPDCRSTLTPGARRLPIERRRKWVESQSARSSLHGVQPQLSDALEVLLASVLELNARSGY
jgi:hypothetical protein